MDILTVVSQALPVPGLSIAVSLATAIWTDVQSVQSNKTQCTRLAERAIVVVEGVKKEVASQRILSDAMQRNITELERALEDIDAFVRSLAQKSFFRRFINKGDIADHIVDLNQRLQTCCELFSMRAAIDVQAWLVQDQQDREADASELRMLLGRALQNDEVLWRTMQLQTDQLLDALNALHRRLDEFPGGSVERGFAEAGVAVLQHMSGQQPGPKSDWEISAFDVEWDETPLAAGAFGTVHRGLWRKTEVAIKFLPSETRQEVLLNEVKIWRSLSHPHVHRFLGCCVNSTPFLVSELCAHGSAVQFLRKRPHTNRPRLVYQIALGMDHLHSKGVLHGHVGLPPPTNVIDTSPPYVATHP